MRIRDISLTMLIAMAFSVFTVNAEVTKEELARQAISPDGVTAVTAITKLRAMGQDGLDALFEAHAIEIGQFISTGKPDAGWDKVAYAIDRVAMQKDAYSSQLYWHTDFDEALKAADKQNKPILSLRLLGSLNEEFSCANSRFFRALLYSNSEISKYLRENYVLHWRSVRPAPRVTIDFGDGRKIERTLTGNSIHYILSEDGTIIDAIPGLYSPHGFLSYITQGREVYRTVRNIAGVQRENALLRFRRNAFDRILAKRRTAISRAKVKLVDNTNPVDLTALGVANLAATKMVTERSILTNIADNFSRYEPGVKLDEWEKLASIYSPAVAFDAASTAFIRRQNRELSDEEFAKLIAKLTRYVALDTTRNDFLLHPQLYVRLNRGSGPVESFNVAVYADLFKTPDSDKWLGLYSQDVYTALDGNGIIGLER